MAKLRREIIALARESGLEAYAAWIAKQPLHRFTGGRLLAIRSGLLCPNAQA